MNLEKSQTEPDPHRVSDLNILSLKLELEQTVPGGWIIQPMDYPDTFALHGEFKIVSGA